MKKNYQRLTEKIARDGGLETDLRANFDPIYMNWMRGNFMRSLLPYSKHPLLKLTVSMGLFIIPGLLYWFNYLSLVYEQGFNREMVIGTLMLIIIESLYLYIGIRLLMSSFQGFSIKKRILKSLFTTGHGGKA